MRKLKRIALKNAHNYRDLGGFATKDNKVTRWHKLYRSDSLNNLTNEEWKYLYINGIRLIVDLRSGAEAEQDKIVVPKEYGELKYINCPVQSVQVQLESEEFSKFTLAESMEKAYIEMFDDDVKLFTKAVITIIDGLEEKGQVVFQCCAGKDRTGVITAMILYLSGAYEEDIIADYEVTFTYNENGVNSFLRTLKAIQYDETKLQSKPENMRALLNHFKEIGLESLVEKYGLNQNKIEKLKTYFLENM